MAQTYFSARQLVQDDLTDDRQHRRQIARTLNLAMNGQSNNTLLVTLEAGVDTTTVTDSRISIQTAPQLTPVTANAAAEVAGGLLYVVPSAGNCVIHHANAVSTDRNFMLSLIG
jgi:hypothetical protein